MNTTYTRRAGALTLTIEPLVTAGHGKHERTYVARVDVDVPEYRTTANVARKHIGARNPMRVCEGFQRRPSSHGPRAHRWHRRGPVSALLALGALVPVVFAVVGTLSVVHPNQSR